MNRFWRCSSLIASFLLVVLGSDCRSDEPIDLFPDAPSLADGFVRIGSWNVRHLEVPTNSERYFSGDDREQDYDILIRSFAKGILDLKLHLVVLVEVQPRRDEPDRLRQLQEQLSLHGGDTWRSAVTHIEYDEPDDPYGNLQFGLLWNETRGVRIDPASASLLEELRQPRSAEIGLLRREQRSPWLIPVTVHSKCTSIEFDLLALHLKSGGSTPQAAEVDAVLSFIQQHQSAEPSRHLIVCGDWNIRPDEDDQGKGRSRLRRFSLSTGDRNLMRVLTVDELRPNLNDWAKLSEKFGDVTKSPEIAPLLPYSHLDSRAGGSDALLDHLAISQSLSEIFDHPIEVELTDGGRDVQPGIEVVRPIVPDSEFLHFTDHFPVVLTLRIDRLRSEGSISQVRLVGIEPNPLGDEHDRERVLIRNVSEKTVELSGWRIQDASRNSWMLDDQDFDGQRMRLTRGRTVTIHRRGRPMTLTNSGDTISLIDGRGEIVDVQRYGLARTSEVIRFD